MSSKNWDNMLEGFNGRMDSFWILLMGIIHSGLKELVSMVFTILVFGSFLEIFRVGLADFCHGIERHSRWANLKMTLQEDLGLQQGDPKLVVLDLKAIQDRRHV